MSDGLPLVEVRIVGMPVNVYREASEHGDELMREFALIREQQAEDGADVPHRLLRLAEELDAQYRGFTSAQQAQLREAIERQERTIDLVYRVPPDVKEACLRLNALLDEADEFCRRGQDLLTLATPPRAVAFRHWFLRQFVDQVDGAAPSPWEEPGSDGATAAP